MSVPLSHPLNIQIKKSPTPIVWIDTSVITNMTIWRNNPEQLEKVQRKLTDYNQNSRLHAIYAVFDIIK